MCGILGGVFRQTPTTEQIEAIRRAVQAVEHRGPDSAGLTTIPSVNAVLAFRRLAIIDLATGDQPMSVDNAYHIIFNGEIYNYREIRERLMREGVPFRTSSDTEVLLRMLARSGIKGLEPLRGMFGFGFVDQSARRLLIARDRLGVKQLYHTSGPIGFFFASEPKALLALPWVRVAFDDQDLAAYFNFRCVPAPKTLFQGIHKLAAGTALTYDITSAQVSVERYWEPPVDQKARTDAAPAAEVLDRFEATFLESIRRRLVADVPVGAFLSGGLDSSMVVAGMRRLGHPEVRTFAATFPGSPDDEGAFARRVAGRFRAAHHEQPMFADQFISAIPRWTELNDDLVADASSLPLLFVSRLARNSGCIVLLSGEGSDELFGGYGSYHKFLLLNRLGRLIPARPIRRGLAAGMERLGLLASQDRPRVDEYFVRRGGFLGTAALLGMAELGELLTNSNGGGPEALQRARGTSMAALCAFDFVSRIPEDLLVRTDRATMGASIEARVPFLDHDLVELVFRFPERMRALPGISKVVLRRLAMRWGVPYQTIIHRKIGFQLPIGSWFRGPMRAFLEAVVRERQVPGLNYETINALVAAHLSGSGRFEELLWRVVALELWYRRWIVGIPVSQSLASSSTKPLAV